MTGSHHNFGCGAGLEEFTVSPNGNMFLCERLSGDLKVNITEDKPPREIWFKYLNDVTNSVCNLCWAKYLCGGGCAHTSFVHNGSRKPYKWHCEIKKTEIENAVIFLYEKINSKKR